MSSLFGRRAVVIGSGIGGLSVAGVLAGYFEQVDVLERDHLPVSARSRHGTPQDRHPHGLLAGGLRALNEIFPDFGSDLTRAGAVPVKIAQEIRYERPDVGALPQRNFNMPILCASRPLIEFVLRSRVEAVANINLRSGCRVTEIMAVTDKGTVQGVRFNTGLRRPEMLEADLVVDASGRGALTMALLDTLAWESPSTTEVGVDISYATAFVQVPENAPSDWKIVLTLPNPPAQALNAVLAPAENNRWMVLIANHGQTTRLETWDSFLQALRRLTTPTLYNALRYATPPADIRHYSFPASLWRHFEQLPSLPRGILPIADSICRFNPIHGQGMSSAAKQARLLQDVMEDVSSATDPIAALQAGFMAKVGSVIQTPWGMSTSADLAFPETTGERSEDFEESRQFEAALFRAAVVDPVVHRVLLEVSQLLQPIDLLHDPDIIRRVEAVSAQKASLNGSMMRTARQG